MKSYYLIALLLASSPVVYAQNTDITPENPAPYKVMPVPTDFLFSYESVNRNDGQSSVGLLGTSFNFNLYKGFYAGPALYEAVQGDTGGLFTIGANVGFRYDLYKNLWLNTGYFAGGGGGGQTTDSNPSGFMSRSHLGLAYDFKYFELGLEYSDVNFPDYGMNSKQWALTFSFPGSLFVGSPDYQGITTDSLKPIYGTQNVDFYRAFLSIAQETYFMQNSTNNSGEDIDGEMQLVNIKGGAFLGRNFYLGVETGGAYDSEHNGYKDFFAIFGMKQYLNEKVFYDAEADIGAGGGGGVDTGSGLIYKGTLGLGYSFTPALSLELDGGYFTAPSGNYEGYLASLGLNYQFLNAGLDPLANEVGSSEFTFEGWSLSAQTETYLNPQTVEGADETNHMNLAVIEMSNALNDTFSVKGQIASAYSGGEGGYASIMFGPGIQSPLWYGFRAIGDILVGGAGGGNVDVDRGAVYQPEAGLSYDITPYISLVAKAGRIMSMSGTLDSTTYNAGIVFNFSTLKEEVY